MNYILCKHHSSEKANDGLTLIIGYSVLAILVMLYWLAFEIGHLGKLGIGFSESIPAKRKHKKNTPIFLRAFYHI